MPSGRSGVTGSASRRANADADDIWAVSLALPGKASDTQCGRVAEVVGNESGIGSEGLAKEEPTPWTSYASGDGAAPARPALHCLR